MVEYAKTVYNFFFNLGLLRMPHLLIIVLIVKDPSEG